MIDLPTSPAPRDVTVNYIDFGSTITPPLGGPEQRINRLGTRHKIDVTMPPMNDDDSRAFIAKLIRGKSEGVRMPFPMNGFDTGASGPVEIHTNTVNGRSIFLRNGTSGYQLKAGQFFSIETNGVHYVYSVSEDNVVNSSGFVASLIVDPLPRVVHQSGDLVHFELPMIEGLIEGKDFQWQYAVDHNVGIQFSIKERR